MEFSFRPLHDRLAAEVTGVDLRTVHTPSDLESIREGMDRFAVLAFRDQPLDDAEQLGFAERFDGKLHTKTGSAVLRKNRFGNEALTDISNLDENGELMRPGDRRRMYGLGNRLWHTDASFEDPPGRYSMLHARVVPPVEADTEFADMRAAYDELDGATKAKLEGLRVHHSIAYSRSTLGFEFSEEERAKLQGAVHPLVRANPEDRPPIALSRLACVARRRLAGAGGKASPPRPHRARDAIALRLPAFLARGRSRDLGQPGDDASRASLRRFRAPPRAATRDDPGPAPLAA
jgi:alpha-ketoglutarate-dependent taurine dioxygenase